MPAIRKCPLPASSLLAKYARAGAYTDCYATDLARQVSIGDYIEAFYTTPLFRIERVILRYAVSRPSTDAEAGRLAAGNADRFAAWSVEARNQSELLMCDFKRRTRSWLMAEPLPGRAATRLLFGSAVVALSRRGTRGAVFSALAGFHKLYSRALLSAAASRLNRLDPPPGPRGID